MNDRTANPLPTAFRGEGYCACDPESGRFVIVELYLHLWRTERTKKRFERPRGGAGGFGSDVPISRAHGKGAIAS